MGDGADSTDPAVVTALDGSADGAAQPPPPPAAAAASPPPSAVAPPSPKKKKKQGSQRGRPRRLEPSEAERRQRAQKAAYVARLQAQLASDDPGERAAAARLVDTRRAAANDMVKAVYRHTSVRAAGDVLDSDDDEWAMFVRLKQCKAEWAAAKRALNRLHAQYGLPPHSGRRDGDDYYGGGYGYTGGASDASLGGRHADVDVMPDASDIAAAAAAAAAADGAAAGGAGGGGGGSGQGRRVVSAADAMAVMSANDAAAYAELTRQWRRGKRCLRWLYALGHEVARRSSALGEADGMPAAAWVELRRAWPSIVDKWDELGNDERPVEDIIGAARGSRGAKQPVQQSSSSSSPQQKKKKKKKKQERPGESFASGGGGLAAAVKDGGASRRLASLMSAALNVGGGYWQRVLAFPQRAGRGLGRRLEGTEAHAARLMQEVAVARRGPRGALLTLPAVARIGLRLPLAGH
jgi:hypothetical protein